MIIIYASIFNAILFQRKSFLFNFFGVKIVFGGKFFKQKKITKKFFPLNFLKLTTTKRFLRSKRVNPDQEEKF